MRTPFHFVMSMLIVAGTAFPLDGAAPEPEKIRIACIGDSITFGSGIPDRDNESYPALLQKMLGDRVEVRNFGDPGRGVFLSTMRGKEKRGYYYRPGHRDALKFNPHIVISNLGINDLDDYRKGGAGDFVEDYLRLLADYERLPAKPQFILWTRLMPTGSKHRCAAQDWPEPFLVQLDLKQVARRVDAIELDMESPFLQETDRLLPDGIHPGPEGAQIIARQTADVLEPFLDGKFALELPRHFSDGMVLPHGVRIPVRGRAARGETVTLTFDETTVRTEADRRGRWCVELAPMKPSRKSRELTVSTGKERIRFKNIVVGEVWLCAGQSNMLFELKHCDDADSAIGEATRSVETSGRDIPVLRFLKLSPPKGWQGGHPFQGVWKEGDRNTVSDFSGVAVFFAVERARSNPAVPIGLVSVSYGGAPLESFLSREALLGSPLRDCTAHYTPWYEHASYAPWCAKRAKEEIDRHLQSLKKERPDLVPAEPDHLFGPSRIFDAALSSLTNFPLTGILWYQGESNATSGGKPEVPLDAARYETAMKLLIGQWRCNHPRTGSRPGELPVLTVQLPRMNRPWASFRAAQWNVSKEVPNVAAIVTTDTGVPDDVHPRDKKPVGLRLARAAERLVDGRSESGVFPEAISACFSDENVLIGFAPAGTIHAQGDGIAGLELLFSDELPIAAKGSLEEFNGATRLVVPVRNGKKPREVRYNETNVTRGNLYSDRNMPVAPFRLNID